MIFPLMAEVVLTEATKQAPAWQFKPLIEVRERFERRTDRDFSDVQADNRSDLFSRWRLGAEAKGPNGVRAVAQFQYAHDWFWTPTRTATTGDSDLFLGFLEWKQAWGTLMVGRNRFQVASARLIGAPEWANSGRSKDGIRIQSGKWDAWGFGLAVSVPSPPEFRAQGVHVETGFGQAGLILKHDKTGGRSTDILTLDFVGKRKQGSWLLDYEGAVQFGKAAGRDHRAWAVHANAKRTLSKQTSAFIELNAASGGGSGNTVRTFDQLVPGNHDKYGYMDLQGWKNMLEFAAGIEHKVGPRLGLLVKAHWFRLFDAKDAWYGAGGAPNRGSNGAFIDPSGQSGREVGFELNFEAQYAFSAQTTFAAGLGTFEPGSFLKRLNGGKANRQVWIYLQANYKF